MNNFFKRLKDILQRLGLTTITRILTVIYNLATGLVASSCDFCRSLIRYFYNNWLTFFPSNLMRILYLKNILSVKIGTNTFIHMGCRFEGNISIGNNTVLGRSCVFNGEIIIGNNVSITAETYIFTSSHEVNDPHFHCFYKPVIIEDYAWIGARAMILPGVKIGKGAVLGAASTATKNIPEYAIFAGIPAKQINTRSRDLSYTLEYAPYFQ